MHFKQKIYNRCNKRGRYILFMKQIRKILVVTMAIAIAATMMLSLKSCVFATESKTSNIIDNSINQGGQVTEIDIPNEDGTFTTLKGEEAKKWYNKAVEEDKEETEEESSMQSTDNEDEVQARGSFLLINIVMLNLSIRKMLGEQDWKDQLLMNSTNFSLQLKAIRCRN